MTGKLVYGKREHHIYLEGVPGLEALLVLPKWVSQWSGVAPMFTSTQSMALKLN